MAKLNGPLERITLDRKQERKWIETRTKFLYDAPMFAHLLYTLMENNGEHAFFTKAVDVAGCDDRTMFINPETFLDRPVQHRVFIMGHEVIHAMMGHQGMAEGFRQAGKITYADGTSVPFNEKTWDSALDLWVNALLVESDIGEPPPDATYDPAITTATGILDVYKTMVPTEDNSKDPGKNPDTNGGGGGGGGGKPNFDSHLPPGTGDDKIPTQAMQERNEDEWRTQIEAAAASAAARGMMPGALQTLVDKLREPVVDWQAAITTLFDRRIGTGTYDWRFPDKRMIARPMWPVVAPGRRGFGAKLIVCVGDSSGSVTDLTASYFFSELAGIIADLNPEKVMFVWCDARTHGWEELEDAEDLERVRKDGAKGRGGTNFRPPFEELAEMGLEPDALVYLTDGDGPFPKEPPPYSVIWGDISNRPSRYPWGDVVQIPVRTADNG